MHSKLFHAARIVAALILLQTLYFKFTAHPESVELFGVIGMEPDGRIATGIVELVAWLLLLFGWSYVRLGAGLWVLLMIWAMYYHITIIGIDQLFWMAVITMISCIYILGYLHHQSKNIVAFKNETTGE